MLLSRTECIRILDNLLGPSNEEKPTLLGYEVVAETNAIGYLGDYYLLLLSYAVGETSFQRQVFVKALPQKSAEPQKEAIFRKEAWLYETLLADMQAYSTVKWLANCYYTRPDLCVLEDIKLNGYVLGDMEELDETQMLQTLHALAALHAGSLIYEHKSHLNIGDVFGNHLQEVTVSPDIAWFTTGLAAVLAVLKTLPQYATPEYASFMDLKLPGILDTIYEQVSTSTMYRNVLCHRDGWAGNIFFPSKPNAPAILVDFQTCRYCPPAIDLSFSLYMNLTSSERRHLESSCIDFYYDCLTADLNHYGLDATMMLPKAELLQSYEEFRLFAAVYRAVAATIIKVPLAYITNEYKYVDRSSAILSYMQDNEQFGACMREYCGDIMEIAIEMKK
ncbi:uncharacterized protein LOC115630695 [Scaptodrosophila lebanonensis]|uniref:Uncharacterized protein LOC115630695 n=1 Tax=Drosophila lebanonensis TaxID=7225 RepID=A0A6J2U7R5_DROLE|nr:uncharacterized protein LOC115630695 [Scaptodrosophila lebanonensis]